MNRAVVAVALTAALASPAVAEDGPTVVRDAERYFELTVPKGWRAVAVPPASEGAEETVLAYRDGDRVMTVVRIDYPNPDRKKRSFHAEVEAGVRAASVDYKRLRRTFGRVRHVVVMDLEFRRGPRKEREYVTMRFLFFRSFTLVFTVVDDRRRSANRALAKGFTPYFAE